jgi:O-antigen ligase
MRGVSDRFFANTLPLLIGLFAFRRLRWRSAGALLTAILLFLAAVWPTSSGLRERIVDFLDEVRTYQPSGMPTSAGDRLEFWRKSVDIIAAAPLFGHGTGSIQQQFRQSAAGQTGMAGLVTADPHNQVLATAIQLGLIGTAVLLAMWIAHLFFFSTASVAAGIGLSVVVQNIVSSLFNSSLLDATHGWVYVLGVGVLSGMILRQLGTHGYGHKEGADSRTFVFKRQTESNPCRTADSLSTDPRSSSSPTRVRMP